MVYPKLTLTCGKTDIGQNSNGSISDFQISGQSLINKNCRNSRAIFDIDMKLGLVNKLAKGNTATSKKLMMKSCRQIAKSMLFFQLKSNLEQSGSWIPNAWSIILTFLLIVTFCFTKTESRSKKYLIQLLYY